MIKKALPRVIGLIPARYGSSRFPGKPLALIAGKSLIQRTYEQAVSCQDLDLVIVATDDSRILDHVHSFGGHAVMTSDSCPTGTDRLVEVIRHDPHAFSDTQIVVNIQGDEPLLDPSVITQLIRELQESTDSMMATAVTSLTDLDLRDDPSIVKCVFDRQGHALYFSRSPIPASGPCYQHVGIYAYRKEFLLTYSDLPATPLQTTEDLEQLKVLEHGHRIRVTLVEDAAIGVNRPEDIEKVEAILCSQNTSSLPAG